MVLFRIMIRRFFFQPLLHLLSKGTAVSFKSVSINLANCQGEVTNKYGVNKKQSDLLAVNTSACSEIDKSVVILT